MTILAPECVHVLCCANDQARLDLPHMQGFSTSLYKKIFPVDEEPKSQWYVEVRAKNFDDKTEATALYHVSRLKEGLKATRITIA